MIETKTNNKLVVIQWRDIIEYSGWEQGYTCPTFLTVGWLVKETADTVVIANTEALEDDSSFSKEAESPFYGLHAFPKGCIVSMVEFSSTPVGSTGGTPSAPYRAF